MHARRHNQYHESNCPIWPSHFAHSFGVTPPRFQWGSSSLSFPRVLCFIRLSLNVDGPGTLPIFMGLDLD